MGPPGWGPGARRLLPMESSNPQIHVVGPSHETHPPPCRNSNPKRGADVPDGRLSDQAPDVQPFRSAAPGASHPRRTLRDPVPLRAPLWRRSMHLRCRLGLASPAAVRLRTSRPLVRRLHFHLDSSDLSCTFSSGGAGWSSLHSPPLSRVIVAPSGGREARAPGCPPAPPLKRGAQHPGLQAPGGSNHCLSGFPCPVVSGQPAAA
ncbi:hypothetical protein NDU88_007548 [Pleurodeles waltl]|uniref:Uncharacterized protein n=1 Tax=Pleurodeles waltl TaxID=8319 RepID=A0AAV7PLM8_PLEWA|nr:hypothetical protein NDU88_007548 [Pleurodeles waltl]